MSSCCKTIAVCLERIIRGNEHVQRLAEKRVYSCDVWLRVEQSRTSIAKNVNPTTTERLACIAASDQSPFSD